MEAEKYKIFIQLLSWLLNIIIASLGMGNEKYCFNS